MNSAKQYIETQRLILRSWYEEDIPHLVRLNSNDKVMEYFKKKKDCDYRKILITKKYRTMKFSNVRLLVKDFTGCFKFYTDKLGLESAWGDENSGYASFKVADGIEGFALFVSDWMAPSVGNADKELPVGFREKSLISFNVDNVDDTHSALKAKGVTFVNEPTDMPGWGMRTVHLRDPEDNLIEFFSPLAFEQYSEELIEESKKYE